VTGARVIRFQFGEPALAPEAAEIAALQRRIRDHHAPVAAERLERRVNEYAHQRRMRVQHVAVFVVAEFMLYPIGLDGHGHAGPYPPAQRIGGIQAQKMEQVAHAVRHRAVIRRGPDGGTGFSLSCSGVHDTEAHTCCHSCSSSSVSAA